MTRFINSLTGTEMHVADDRVEEYIAAGHVLVADAPVKAKKAETVKEEPKEEPKKEVIRKAPAKKSASAKKK